MSSDVNQGYWEKQEYLFPDGFEVEIGGFGFVRLRVHVVEEVCGIRNFR